MRTLLPVVLSAVGTVPVFVARFAGDAASVGRSVVALVLYIAVAVTWVRRRDPWGRKIREFLEEGRAASA
jgi:ABC-type tungstate transport system substrate-binding protein